MSTQYLCGDGIIVSGADGLSRGEDAYDCRLCSRAYERLLRWQGPFDVDCCAAPGAVQSDVYGRQLPYVSPYGGQGCVGVDALTFSHPGMLYAFPPAILIPALVAHVVRQRLRMVMVVPEWPTQAWWPLVCGWPSMRLGPVRNVVEAGQFGLAHPFGRSFREPEAVEMVAFAINV